MYRPEGISAEKVLEDFGEITSFTMNTDLVNAGMDAMLEGLRQGGEDACKVDCWLTPIRMESTASGNTEGLRDVYGTPRHMKGTRVTIPDDTP